MGTSGSFRSSLPDPSAPRERRLSDPITKLKDIRVKVGEEVKGGKEVKEIKKFDQVGSKGVRWRRAVQLTRDEG